VTEGAAGRGPALLAVARHALTEAVGVEAPPPPGPDAPVREWLSEPGASFVTLRWRDELRGCIGCLEPSRPLVDDVRRNARAAALEDRRFAPVTASELGEISVEVSVLSALDEIDFADESELLAKLRPGVDGVVLECDGRRGTFLPQVWESLAEPALFLEQLKLKAGLSRGFWSDNLRAWRYRVEKFEEPSAAAASSPIV